MRVRLTMVRSLLTPTHRRDPAWMQPNRVQQRHRSDTGHRRGVGGRREEHPMDIISDGPTLVLQGAFDVRSTWEVRAAIYAILDGPDDDVVVDMTHVTTIDVTALRLLAVATR